jgi:hypothetical protein
MLNQYKQTQQNKQKHGKSVSNMQYKQTEEIKFNRSGDIN